MLGDKIKVQSKVVSDYTDEQLLFIKLETLQENSQ